MSRYIDVTDLSKQISDFKRAVNSPNSDYMTGYICALSVTEGIIAKAPTADVVEVRHGTWYHSIENGAVYAKCSACRRKMNYICYGYAYCCLCGAKMDAGGREE